MPPDLIRLVAILAVGGYRIDIRRVLRASYHAIVFDGATVVGDIAYRSNLDEREPHARGLSYAVLRPDRTLRLVQKYMARSSRCSK